MSSLVIYCSRYGSTENYASELAKKMGWEAVSYKDVNNSMLQTAESIVLASNIRIGKMKLANWAKNRASVLMDKCKAVLAVGGAESSDQDYYIEIVEKNLPFLKLKKEQIFGLGGRQVIADMKGLDAFMFKMLDKVIKDPQEKEKMMKDKDHVDMKLLEPVIAFLNK